MDAIAVGARSAAPGRNAFAWVAPATADSPANRPAHASLCMTCPVRAHCLGAVAPQAGTHELLSVLAGRRLLPAGEAIVLPRGGVCVVRRGSLKSLTLGTDGGQARCFHFPGEAVAASSEVGLPIVALEDTELCVMRTALSDGAVRPDNACLGRLWDMTSRDLLRERAQAAGLAALSPVRRITAFIADTAQRARVVGATPRILQLNLSASDIASYLGVPSDTVRRVLGVLARREVLLLARRHFIVVNHELLQFAARQD
ncbi:Crp/Fnr family transcriptional regulator [Ramlibacter sp. XY19]|uniref:Crp/Fnr family transcriptional regulator n=1 Tax=Ramlibacter paludis TaxID=2908000 RepID=UPI0023DBC6CD|nr:Crp/Fnr family transcriptional regulator [Ramlibacter paludis]MCG2595064.1 Crp/Fnr family transcriptional regulator [Ramlibacter paludis]